VPNRDFSSDVLIVKHILSIEASNGCPFLLCIRVGLEKRLVDLKRERKRRVNIQSARVSEEKGLRVYA